MKYFAGLDVSLEATPICMVDKTAQIMKKEARAASEPEALDALLSNLGLPLERLGLEACSLTAWWHGELKAPGWPAICIGSRQESRQAKAATNKTDRNDARAIAQIMRTGWFCAGHVKDINVAILAFAAGRAPDGCQRDAVDRNRARAILRETGRKLGTPARKDFVVRARERIGAKTSWRA
jgi:transposase